MKKLFLSAIASLLVATGLHAQIAPNFTLPDLKTGTNVNLYDFEDQVVVLKFFAYW